jgi:UDP-N-acetyl-D-mannosaminuronic acid dehydrogenase
VHYQKICVLGLGYIGLPTASTFATQGLQVVGVDINPQVVEILRNGGLHIHEPGLRTLVQAALVSGNLTIAGQPEQADAFRRSHPARFTARQPGGARINLAAAHDGGRDSADPGALRAESRG